MFLTGKFLTLTLCFPTHSFERLPNSRQARLRMNLKTFIPELKNRFEQYVKQFASPDPNIQAALDLKQAHTRRVCEAIVDIGEDLLMAEATALLHDIGRFEQFRRYKTFSDARSENHALLGVKVIQENASGDDTH